MNSKMSFQCGINNGIFSFFFFKNGDVLIVYTVNNTAPGPQRALISKCFVLSLNSNRKRVWKTQHRSTATKAPINLNETL